MTVNAWTRRDLLFAGAAAGLLPLGVPAEERRMITRQIPSTDEALPVVGLGTYEVFDVAGTPEAIATCKEIVDLLLRDGGRVLDTSPMYNRSEGMIGDVITAGSPRDSMFLASKVWTDGQAAGARQIERSLRLMESEVVDLMQVHNLRDTDSHMATIRQLQEQGRVRYAGLTHYRADAHDRLAAAMRRHRPEFIQVNYSLGERDAEQRLLPLAQEMGVAVIINRPYQAGELFRRVAAQPLPHWANEFAASWGQFFLKFIISHPAVSCVIPATSKPHHMIDNLGAGIGTLPDGATRQRMAAYFAAL